MIYLVTSFQIIRLGSVINNSLHLSSKSRGKLVITSSAINGFSDGYHCISPSHIATDMIIFGIIQKQFE